MCIRDRVNGQRAQFHNARDAVLAGLAMVHQHFMLIPRFTAVSYTHLRAHETVLDIVCRLLLEKKKNKHININYHNLHKH